MGAQEACETAARRVNALAERRGVQPARLAFIALDTHGNPGACCTAGTGFQYAVGRAAGIELLKAKEIG
jgi:N4-(beta-N-acetylglucosaminyl)-L-asparaginase